MKTLIIVIAVYQQMGAMATEVETLDPCRGYGYEDQSAILTSLLNQKDYDKRLRPGAGFEPVVVNVTIHIVNMGPISEYDMTFKLSVFVEQFWMDPRLSFDGCRYLVVGYDVMQQIWTPDLFFHSETWAELHTVTSPNFYVRIHPSGMILMSFQATVKNGCLMNLEYYPMDRQTCEVRLASYGYSSDDLIYLWKDTQYADDNKYRNPISFEGDKVELTNYQMLNRSYKMFIRNLSTGSWPTLRAEFVFGRNTLYFIIQMYVPSTLIVVLSWVTFWVGQSSIPARAALGITAVLTILTLMNSTNSNMPKISYMKAIDLYYAGCFLFVFATLIEFGTVCFLEIQEKKVAAKETDAPPGTKPKTLGVDSVRSVDFRRRLEALEDSPWNRLKEAIFGRTDPLAGSRLRISVARIDQYSRFCFPITFFSLKAIYWIIFWPRSDVDYSEKLF